MTRGIHTAEVRLSRACSDTSVIARWLGDIRARLWLLAAAGAEATAAGVLRRMGQDAPPPATYARNWGRWRTVRVHEDIEVVFDLPTDAFHPCYPVAGHLDAEVRRMRFEVMLASVDWEGRHGSAAEALELLAPHRTAPEGALISALLVCTHRRFERCSRTLMRRLDVDDLLDASDLDRLAAILLGRSGSASRFPRCGWTPA